MKEEYMKRQKLLIYAVLSWFVLVLMAGAGFAQGQAKAQDAPAKQALETIKGIIDYNERLGGYFIRGVEPGGDFFIVNQNPAVLKKLKEGGKTLIIKGRTGQDGADYFIIEKIGGKKYSAAKTAPQKATPKGNE
jgi:hypothetical protein